ncbi:MAG: hypothetical protein NT027_16015 [Proteobacteria bacterium]|nr:hypothetical protein [Pseudomonadota bacterium]
MKQQICAAISLSLSLLISLSGCGTKSEDASTKQVEDISSMVVQSDGTYRVTCKNGSIEVRTAEEIKTDQVCRGGGSGSGLIFCTSSSDNLLKRGTLVLHDFDNQTDCLRARDEARKYRAFCTSSSDNLLKDITGKVVHDFSNEADCQRALLDGQGNPSSNPIFCTSSTDNLLKMGTRVLHDFSNPEECARARDQAKRYSAFCTGKEDNLLKSLDGTIIHDYSSPDECQRALEGSQL